MGRWLALLSLAVLVVGIAAIDPCKRQPFRGRCPSENGAAPKRSQFVLRYYSRSGECVSYPYGHCASDESEPVLYRLKEECEDACIKNNEPPANLGDPKDQPYSTIGPLDVKAEGVKIVTQEPLSITESPGTKSTTTEAVTTTESTTTEKQTEATTTTTEKSTTVAATTTTKTTTTEEAKTTQKITTTEEPSTTNIEKTTTTEKVTEAPTTKTTTPETTFTVKAKTTEEPKTTVREAEAPKFEKKVDATTEADVESTTPEVKSTTAPRRTETHAPVVTRNVVVVQYATEAATEATTTKDAETTRSPRTECERRRSASASSKIRGGFVPVCDANGEFEKTQCEPNGEQCFCVDRRGIEVANTRNHDGKKPNCEQIAASPRTHLKSCGGVAEKGPCSSNLGRWFYSESEKKCMQFIYSGCGGNGNNYDSERDCLARCASVPAMPVLKCLKGEPLKSKQGDIVLCGKANCPTGYKCTQQQQTSFCCPEEIEKLVVAKPVEELNAVCKMSKERGPCDKYELRFHFDIAKNECKYFFWGGCEGNANNFVDIESCEQTCGISKTRGFTSAPRPPTPQTTMGIRVTTENQQVPTTEEPVVEEQEVDENDSLVTTTRTTTRARPVAPTRHREPATVVPTTVRPVKSIEDLPIRENHPTHAIRQHMEIVTRRPVVPMLPENRCIHPKDSGNCRGQFIRWFYDNQKKLCDVFTYTGCEGNGNNFASREECNAICHKEVVRPVIPDFSNVCKHDVDAGECPGVFQRFAFDTESGECRPFTYGGCGGNGNNFATIAECRASCQKATAVKQVNKCDNDVEAGQCTGAFTRFGYDKEINDCKQFVYGGCGGNGNNFPSITKCRNSCVKKSCKPTPPCESGRCQLLNDNNGCPFCSCEPVKQPSPPATNDRCPHFSFADCQEPCLIIKNRRGCQECKCPELPSTVIPPNPHPPAPHHEVAQPPSRPTEVGPPSPGRANSPGFRDNSVTEGIRVTTNPSLPNGMLNDLQEKCMQPVEPGPCTNFADRWFFSSEDGTCHPFKYGGCAGNKNHFFTQRECEIHCGRFLRPADNTQSSEEEEEKNNFENKQFAAKRLDVISPVPVENYSSPTPVTVVTHSAPGSYGKKQLDILPIAATQALESMNGKAPVTTQGIRATSTTRAPTTTATTTTVKTTTTESEEEEEEPVEITSVKNGAATTSMPTVSSTVSETVTSPTLSTILSNNKLPTPTLDAIVKNTKNTLVENTTTTTEKPRVETPTTVVNEINSMESEEETDDETEQTTKVTAKPIVVTTVSEKEEREMYISSKFQNEKVLKETDEVRKFEEVSLPAKGDEPEVEHRELKKLDIQKIHNEITETEEYEDSEEDVQESTVAPKPTEPSTTAAPTTTTKVETTKVTEAATTVTKAVTVVPTVATEPSTVPTETSPVTTAASSTTAEPSTTVSVTTTTTQGTTSTTPNLSTEAPKPSTEDAPKISSDAPGVIENIGKEHVSVENIDSDSDESATDEVIEMTTQTPKVNGVVRVEPKEDREIVTKINTDDNESEELSELPNNVGKVPIAFDLDKLDETIVKDAAPVPTISAETTTKAATTASVVPTEAFDARVVCSFPADAGSCFNYVTRWFFNSQTGQCEQFSFGQCGGNGNNFNDRTTCELKCMIAHPTLSSQVPERCTYDKNSGFGQGYNVKWYFNMKNLRCEQFVYEGQGGNSNQFETLSDCERICTPQPTFNKPAVGATTRLVQNLEITTAATEAPTTRSVPSTEAHTTRRAETTATPTTVTAPSTESVQVQTTRAAAPPAPETATAQSRQLKPLPDISVNTVPNSKEMTSEEIDKDYEELDKDLIRPAVPTLAPQQTTEEPQVLPVVPNQPEPIQPFEPQPQPPKELPVLEASSPGTEPRPPSPAHASKTIVIEEIEKPAVQETTTKQPHYTASPISLTEEPTRDEQLKIVGKSAVATHNYQTGEVHLNGITNFGDEKLSVEKLSEISGLPSCPNNARELRHPNTGAPFMCLPGKNQCPQGSNCYFNGVNFFCCPNIEDPYDKHVFGGYGGEEAKNGYKVFGPLRIRRLMDEIPLRAKRHVVEKRQTSMDLAFNTVPVSFNLDSVIAPLRFDAEKPRSVSRAERMKKPRPPQHGNQMCLLPLIKGDCKEAHLRYFYDRHSDSCRLFYYSGCQGNGNNFGSLEDCQRLCVLGNQPRESYVLAADISTPSVVSPGQCPTGAPLGGSAPVLCGNSTDSIGCPTGYYCRGGPPDVCCPGIAPNSVSENKIYGIKQHTVASASVEEKSVEVVEKSGRRGYHKEALLATPKYMCPDASDPLMGSDGEPQICGTGINADGMKMCPKGFYCAIDSAKGSRLCCPLYGAAQRIPAELVLAPYFGRRASNPGEVIGRGSLPTDADASTEVKSREKSTEVPAKNLEFDVTGVKDVPSTSAPTSTSVEVVTKQEAEEDSDEYEDDEPEGTTKPQRLMMKDEPNRHNRIQEKTASESPKAADIPAETMNIDMPKDVVTPAVEETPVPTKSMDDKSICHIKPNEGRACRADEKAPRTNLQYFYSAKDNRCKLYFYKGCGGTDNRFEKKADCEALCLRK